MTCKCGVCGQEVDKLPEVTAEVIERVATWLSGRSGEDWQALLEDHREMWRKYATALCKDTMQEVK